MGCRPDRRVSHVVFCSRSGHTALAKARISNPLGDAFFLTGCAWLLVSILAPQVGGGRYVIRLPPHKISWTVNQRATKVSFGDGFVEANLCVL